MSSDKQKKIDALRKLANDQSTTPAERLAALNAIKALGENPATVELANLTTSNDSNNSGKSNIELAKFKMPEWVSGAQTGSRYYGLFSSNKRLINHPVFLQYERAQSRNDQERMSARFSRNEFWFNTYGNLGVLEVRVYPGSAPKYDYDKVGHSLPHIKIYDGHQQHGYREGPWWNDLEALFRKWNAEADEYDRWKREKLAAEMQAKRDAENALFSDYMRARR